MDQIVTTLVMRDAWTEKSGNFNPNTHKRIAIFSLYGDRTGAVTDALTTEFFGMGYEVVERTGINAVLKEMKLEYSGMIDIMQKKEVARVTNADAIVFGSVKTTMSGDIHFLDLRFVDIVNGDILWSCNYLNRSSSSPRESISKISKSIQEKIKKQIQTDEIPYAQSRLSIVQNTAAPGKKYKKVALLPLSGTNIYDEDSAVYGALITSFIGNGVEMVERKELEGILKEHLNSAGGLYYQDENSHGWSTRTPQTETGISTAAFFSEYSLSKEELSDIGRITGADALLMGSFQSVMYSPFTFTMANLRLINLATGKIALSASYYNNPSQPDDYVMVADWLAVAIAPTITAISSKDYADKFELAIENKRSPGYSIIERITPAE
ncbi:MAG: hypothetical protein NTY45_09265 [Elusimicrobia bacterium]|nr:hypothetical protein [Elusimicrobiota bacterium]